MRVRDSLQSLKSVRIVGLLSARWRAAPVPPLRASGAVRFVLLLARCVALLHHDPQEYKKRRKMKANIETRAWFALCSASFVSQLLLLLLHFLFLLAQDH